MEPEGPVGSQRVSLEFFDGAGRRVGLEGRVASQSRGAMCLDLPVGEAALGLVRGLQLHGRRAQAQVQMWEIGGKGAGVYAPCSVQPGTALQFEIAFPDLGPCLARAEV